MAQTLKFNQSLNQQQKLSQKLSQQQIQSVNMLGMSSVDLRDDVYEFALKNPALEIVNDPYEEGEKNPFRSKPGDGIRLGKATNAGVEASDRFQAALESNADDREALSDHLEHQFLSMHHTPHQEALGLNLIHNLDKNGFHILSPESFLPSSAGMKDFDTLAEIMDQIQQLDPPGTCVKNFEESLYVQAKQREFAPESALFLLNGHFDFLNPPVPAKILKKVNDWLKETAKMAFLTSDEQTLIKELKESPFDEQDIEEALSFIRTLDPFPARNFDTNQIHYVSADIIVEEIIPDEDDAANGIVSDPGKSTFKISLTYDTVPSLTINREYEKLAMEDTKNLKTTPAEEQKKNEIRFARDSVAAAKIYIDSITFRENTMAKAAAEIVRNQISFFEKGPRYLAPLRQKDIAAALGVHETTISRMANSKFLQCKWGLFELKYFFTNAVNTENTSTLMATINDSPAASKEAVKFEINAILQEHKNDKKALSDQKISDLLAEKGIKIARRTVAKYRSELNVNSSYER